MEHHRPTDRAETITEPPPPDESMLALAELPGHSATGFGFPSARDKLIGKLSYDLERYHEDAREDRRLASHDRQQAIEAAKLAREWFKKLDARQDHQLGLIQGDIQRINARLEEGDGEFKGHRAEIKALRAALEAKDGRISELVDHVTALSIDVQQSSMQSPPYTAEQGALSGVVILLLEDSERVRTATTRVLKRYGARVLQASTIEEAEAILDDPSSKLHVVAVDLLIGTESAMPFVRTLREKYSVGVVIVTGDISESDRAEAAALGIVVIGKPFFLDSLIEAVKSAAVGL